MTEEQKPEAEQKPEVAAFRYRGAVVQGEKQDADGVTVPNIIENIEVFGYAFSKRKFTEVPLDAVAYSGRRLNRLTGVVEPFQVTVVEKLRGNREFEERGDKK